MLASLYPLMKEPSGPSISCDYRRAAQFLMEFLPCKTELAGGAESCWFAQRLPQWKGQVPGPERGTRRWGFPFCAPEKARIPVIPPIDAAKLPTRLVRSPL